MSGAAKTWETLAQFTARNRASAETALNFALRTCRATAALTAQAVSDMEARLAAGRSALLSATSQAFNEDPAVVEAVADAGKIRWMEPTLGIFVAEFAGHVVRLPEFNKPITQPAAA